MPNQAIMEISTLKSSIARYVASSDDKAMLSLIHSILSAQVDPTTKGVWNDLTALQKDKILSAYAAIEQEDKLISLDELFTS